VYSVKKFPDFERDTWIAHNRELIDEQLKLQELPNEALRETLEQVMTEYVFLSDLTKEMMEWKQNFARFLSYAINAAEVQIEQSEEKKDFQGGRLSVIKEILEWF